MLGSRRHSLESLAVVAAFGLTFASPVAADELWVAPTYQQDVGGLGIGSNGFWPATVAGAARFALGVPDNLQTFQHAKIVLIPHAPGGAATLNVFVCAAQAGQPVAGACAGPFAHAFTGVVNQLTEVDISADVAPRVGVAGANHLAVVAYTTPTTTTDHLVGLRFGYGATLPNGVATLGANSFSGTQTAPAFVGNGSGLTNLPIPSGVATLGANNFNGTQTAPAFVGNGSGLTNLPIPPGAATVGANTFTGNQTVNAGNLDLDGSTSTAGNLTKNGTRFLHNFGASNIFLGANAGNFAMTGDGNTASGALALFSNSSGSGNTAIGVNTLFSNTTGTGNAALGGAALISNVAGDGNTASGGNALGDNIDGDLNTADGNSALRHNTSGAGNTASGVSALFFTTTGNRNTASGNDALRNNATGSNNAALGWNAGSAATTGSNNVYLGANVVGSAGESNAIYLGTQGTQTKTVVAGIRGTAVSGGEMVLVDATGRLGSAPAGPAPNSIGTNEVINDSLTSADLAAGSVTASELAANAVGPGHVTFNYAGSATKGGPAIDLACAACITASEVSFSFATPGANTFTGTQTINAGNIDLDASTSTTGNILKDGTRFLHTVGGTANLYLGLSAGNLAASSGSVQNTGIGSMALSSLQSGYDNTAVGANSLVVNTTGVHNTAIGNGAMDSNTFGFHNTAVGSGALSANTGGTSNTAIGFATMLASTSGDGNTTLGLNGFAALSTGSFNLGLGYQAGYDLVNGSNNLYVDNKGMNTESDTTRIGDTQTRTFVSGIRSVTTGMPNAVGVVIDSNGQLGTVSSSRRFKEDIHEMADSSLRLLQLRPVTFRYKEAYADGTKPVQFGLIAEEVTEVFPELPVRGSDGRIETVHYETLSVLLRGQGCRISRASALPSDPRETHDWPASSRPRRRLRPR